MTSLAAAFLSKIMHAFAIRAYPAWAIDAYRTRCSGGALANFAVMQRIISSHAAIASLQW